MPTSVINYRPYKKLTLLLDTLDVEQFYTRNADGFHNRFTELLIYEVVNFTGLKSYDQPDLMGKVI